MTAVVGMLVPVYLGLFEPGGDDKAVDHTIEVRWAPLPGATAARLDGTATLQLGAPEGTVIAPALPLRDASGWLGIDIPANRAVHELTCTGLVAPIAGTALVVAVLVNGKRTPVGAVGAGATTIGSFQGPVLPRITLTNGNFSLPVPTVTTRVLLGYVTGDVFTETTATKPPVTRVDAVLSKPAGALALAGPDGSQLWARTPLPATGRESLDVTDALRTGLEASLDAPAAVFKLTGPAGAFAAVRFSAPSGVLVREWPDTLTVELAGEPAPLPIEDVAAEVPKQVRAGHFAFHYAGIRLHDTLRDELPGPGETVTGTIVGAEGAVRTLAPLELEGPPVVRVAVIGSAPEPCTLAIGPADASGATFAGRPGTLELAASQRPAVHWVELAASPELATPATIAVRALEGRFLWADGPHGPRVRVAVADPDPGGRPIRLGTDTLAIDEQRDVALTPFAGTAPSLSSDLFGRAELTGLSLEYRR